MNILNLMFQKIEIIEYLRRMIDENAKNVTIKLNKINRQNDIYIKKMTNLKNFVKNLQIALNDFRNTTKINVINKNRYKNLRNQHRIKNDNHFAKMLKLRIDKTILKKQLKKFETRMKKNVKIYDDDYFIDDSNSNEKITKIRQFRNYFRFQFQKQSRQLLSKSNEINSILTFIRHNSFFDEFLRKKKSNIQIRSCSLTKKSNEIHENKIF